MLDLLDQVAAWSARGRSFALATVVRTWGSSPREPGAAMAVAEDGEVVGSVSGGCVEGAVHDLALRVLATGEPVLETYGVSDDDAFAVGLTCGGILQVFVERVDATSWPNLADLRAQVAGRRAVAVATVIEGAPDVTVHDRAGSTRAGGHLVVGANLTSGTLGRRELDHAVAGHARGLLEHGRTAVVRTGSDGQQREDGVAVFVESFAPAPTMFVYGAIDFAGALVNAAKFIGYHVVLCDARPVFATTRRFPEADQVEVAWPHEHLQRQVDDGAVDERTVICVLTHDPKFDVPLLDVALRTKAAYVGAMGSRRTHQDRLARLREQGVDEGVLASLHSPIGLDLGAHTPAETAVSITAEIIAQTWGGTGRPLRDLDEAIHP